MGQSLILQTVKMCAVRGNEPGASKRTEGQKHKRKTKQLEEPIRIRSDLEFIIN